MRINSKILALLFLLLPLTTLLSAQDEMRVKHNCNFQGEEKNKKLYIFEPNLEAQQIVEALLQTNGLTSNSFVLKEANCQNALATVESKKRYILYNPTFLEKFKQDPQTIWAAYCVLAHEIAHHLEGHDLEETNPKIRKNFELEADKFAGHMLFRMGATLEESQAGINTAALENETSTHPPKSARLIAIANGWAKARDQYADPSDFKEKIEGLFKSASEEKDFEKQINYYTKIIQLDPNDIVSYNNRGVAKEKLGRYIEAIIDYDKVIQLDPNRVEAYASRGVAKGKMKKYVEAIIDYDKAIVIDSNFVEAYGERGNAKCAMKKYADALVDYDRAIFLKPEWAKLYNNRGNAKHWLLNDKGAIEDYNKAIDFDSSFPEPYNNRGNSKNQMSDFKGAIVDLNKAIELKPNYPDAYSNRGRSKIGLGEYVEAIADFDKAIEVDRDFAAAYGNKGCLLVTLGKYEEGIENIDKGLMLDSDIISWVKTCKDKAIQKLKN